MINSFSLTKEHTMSDSNDSLHTYLVSFSNENGDDGCFVRTSSIESAIEIAKNRYPEFTDFSAIESPF